MLTDREGGTCPLEHLSSDRCYKSPRATLMRLKWIAATVTTMSEISAGKVEKISHTIRNTATRRRTNKCIIVGERAHMPRVRAKIEISISRVRALPASYPIHSREIPLAGHTNYKFDFVKISREYASGRLGSRSACIYNAGEGTTGVARD